jgi:hypothetical protein
MESGSDKMVHSRTVIMKKWDAMTTYEYVWGDNTGNLRNSGARLQFL